MSIIKTLNLNPMGILKEGDEVTANIAYDEKDVCDIQAVIVQINEKTVRVREVDTDDEWELSYDKIRKQ